MRMHRGALLALLILAHGAESGRVLGTEAAMTATPTVTVTTNKIAYRSGDVLTVSVSLTNPGASRSVDAYFGVQLTDGRTLLYLSSAGFGQAITPIARAFFLDANTSLGPVPVYSLTLPASVAGGTYTLFLTLTETGNLSAFVTSGTAVITFAGGQPGGSQLDETPPVLSVPIVDLSGTYDPASKRLGALNCNFLFATDPSDRFCFNAFGRSVVPGKVGVSFDYKVAAGSEVRAATAGTVMEIEAETNPLYPDEFEIRTQSSDNSAYLVIYDHVKNLRVSVGSAVSPGTVLGTAGVHGPNSPASRTTFGRVELQINHTLDPRTRRSEIVCPSQFGTTSFNQANDTALAAHNAANPAYTSASLCLVNTLPAQ